VKIVLVGDYNWFWYQEACAQEFERQGNIAVRFSWFDDFKKYTKSKVEPVFKNIIKRFEYRTLIGPTIYTINRRLIRVVEEEKPDVVFIYNGKLIKKRTLRKLRKLVPNIKIALYANDNPFVSPPLLNFWHNYLKCISEADVCLAYRESDFSGYLKHGASKVEWLRSYFIEDEDYPIPRVDVPSQFKCDVVFAGHFENDSRIPALEKIIEAGFDLKLYGGGWEAASEHLGPASPLLKILPVEPAIGEDYRYAICGAKVALCFLSTLNSDTYTRRNFQIPAMRVAMLTQSTEDLLQLFPGNLDCVFFSSNDELLSKLKELVEDYFLRSRVAEAGYKRVWFNQQHLKGRVETLIRLFSS